MTILPIAKRIYTQTIGLDLVSVYPISSKLSLKKILNKISIEEILDSLDIEEIQKYCNRYV